MGKKILLVDGNSILNRGYYGLPLLSNADGIFTNGILGFLNILFKVIDEESPDYLTVAFDVNKPTFRHEMFAEYKGTRKPAPEELRMQFPIIREVLSSMGVNIVEVAGFEADDLLGTLAKKAECDDMDVTLLSGDRDLLQIASDRIKISIPKTKGGKTETFNYFAGDVLTEIGVTPTEYIDVKALQGDTSDNIPGVPSVGPKSAVELISKYHDLEGIYDNIDNITKKALNQKLKEFKEQAFLSRDLARINTNAPISVEYDLCTLDGLLNDKSMEVFIKYSLKSVVSKLEKFASSDNTSNAITTTEIKYSVVEDFNETTDIINRIKKSSKVSVYSLGENGVAVSLAPNETYVIRTYGFVSYDYLTKELSASIDKCSSVITYSIKNSYDYLGSYKSSMTDVELLAYLIEPTKGDYSISYISEAYLSSYYGSDKDIMADKEAYAAICASVSFAASDILKERVSNMGMLKLFNEVEMPLSYVLYSMEKEGVLVDRNMLKEYGTKLKAGIDSLEKEIYNLAGCEFNINSPKQLGEILFEKLGLPGGKKTKSGYSTAADVLDKLAPDYEVVSKVLEYRALSKLNSTYAEGLTNCIGNDGRIHTHFNQTITATGRISSTDPNLQNIPIRTEIGRELRKVFVPKEGFVFVDSDYSQIELRLMAHMSGDSRLIEAYRSGKDIHRTTASLVFNVPFDEVTDNQRRSAKAVNFGIIYGISAFGLSQDIGTSVSDAKKYIEDYFVKYPDVKKYLDNTVNKAKEDGYSETIFGRKRPIPELKASNFMQRSFGERVAMNAPLQGTAADIMKIAMINIFNRINSENLESRLLIQVHDEVLIETKKEELEAVLKLVTEEMEKAAELLVPLVAESHYGDNWFDAK